MIWLDGICPPVGRYISHSVYRQTGLFLLKHRNKDSGKTWDFLFHRLKEQPKLFHQLNLLYGDRLSALGGFLVDTFFCFTITYRTTLLQKPIYSEYQEFLYKTISKLRETGLTFNQIADQLNTQEYKTPRGKLFTSAHAHSIVKKRRIRDETLKRECPPVWSDFYLEAIDKTLVMSYLQDWIQNFPLHTILW